MPKSVVGGALTMHISREIALSNGNYRVLPVKLKLSTYRLTDRNTQSNAFHAFPRNMRSPRRDDQFYCSSAPHLSFPYL